jgi:hypothetical protein
MFSGQRNVLLAFVLVGLYMLHYEMLLHPATNMILATVSVAIVVIHSDWKLVNPLRQTKEMNG